MANGYQVIDKQTGNIVKEYGAGKRKLATKFADKKDQEYGAIRYIVKPIFN